MKEAIEYNLLSLLNNIADASDDQVYMKVIYQNQIKDVLLGKYLH